jgi:ankyrin repeat protein
LVTHGADIHQKDAENDDCLALAVLFRNYYLAQYLLEQGADVNSLFNEDHTCADDVVPFVNEYADGLTSENKSYWKLKRLGSIL